MAKFYTPTKLSDNIRETPEGFLVCLAVPIARTGWMEYAEGECPLEPGEDGVVHVYRDGAEVFRPQTIASFEGKAVTIKHPIDFVTPDNWSYLSKGVVQNVRRSSGFDEDGEESLLADLLITEAMAIQLVKNGLREVSCGYEAEYEQTEVGKGRQTKIVGNHLALVEQGRAGSSYAINDKKGEASVSPKLLEKLKAKFGAKAVDEAMAEGKEEKSKDEKGYDELVKMVKDLSDKIDGMGKGKDEEKPAKEKPAKEDEKSSEDADEEEKSEDDEEDMKLEERIKALEAAVAKMLEKSSDEESSDEDEEEKSEDDESDMSGDEDEEESAEDASAEGEEEQSKKKTGDALMLSRAEILSPGIKKTKGSDIRVEALKNAYQSKDGKAVIHALTGGKKPTFDAKGVDALFVAASEVLKAKRGTGLEKTKDGKKFDVDADAKNELMTPEKMNELHAAHWARK